MRGCPDIDQRPIVAPTAACAVVIDPIGLWIVPDLWKTRRARFPQGPWTAHRTRRPHAPQALAVSVFERAHHKRLARHTCVS